MYSKQSTILPTKFKSTIGLNQKIAIPGRLTPADATKILLSGHAKFWQLINIQERQSAIISVAVTDDLAAVRSGSKKPGYPSRLDPATFDLFDAPKKLP
ncbi:hypothetical protein [Microcoleus sp. herbarium2]|uniref:hypothetical protein n=1 Tax=Microcoleus sp. herbarium2 TaxID=3055433 RepID=UPI002FCEFC65